MNDSSVKQLVIRGCLDLLREQRAIQPGESKVGALYRQWKLDRSVSDALYEQLAAITDRLEVEFRCEDVVRGDEQFTRMSLMLVLPEELWSEDGVSWKEEG